MKAIKSILLERALDESGKYISREFQHYAYALGEELGDLGHKSLYMKLAKSIDRQLLEAARLYVKDYPRANNKARLFMWKLAQLRKAGEK